MITTKINSGTYTVTGYTAKGDPVQYEVWKNAHLWTVDLIYGNGETFNMGYDTKAQAVAAIKAQG